MGLPRRPAFPCGKNRDPHDRASSNQGEMRIGADVVAIVADGAGENRAWWSAVGTRDGDGALRLAHVSHSRPVFYILPDMPHIVKRLRKALDSEVIRKFGKAIIITTTEIPKGTYEHPSHARGHPSCAPAEHPATTR